jgi:hypothetical protein
MKNFLTGAARILGKFIGMSIGTIGLLLYIFPIVAGAHVTGPFWCLVMAIAGYTFARLCCHNWREFFFMVWDND